MKIKYSYIWLHSQSTS